MKEDFTNAQHEFTSVVNQIILDLERYKRSPDFNKNYFNQSCKKVQVISNFHYEAVFFINELFEIIKKQALIIEAAGIKYPTINQSVEHIHDIYLQSKGRGNEVGNFRKDEITVEIPLI